MNLLLSAFIFLAVHCSASEALDTMRAEFSPHIDIDEYWIVQVLEKEAKILRSIKENHTTIDDYFSPKDFAAAYALAKLFLNNFTHATKYLIKMKFIVAKLTAIREESDPIFEVHRREFPKMFTQDSNTMFARLLNFGENFTAALDLCESETCVRKLRDSALELTRFTKNLSKGLHQKNYHENNFSRLILERAYAIEGRKSKDKIAIQAYKEMIGDFLALWDGEISAEQAWVSFLGSDEERKRLNLSLDKTYAKKIKSINQWIIGASETAAFNLIHHSKKSYSYQVHDFGKKIILRCKHSGMSDERMSFLVGFVNFECKDSSNYQYNAQGISFGAEIGGFCGDYQISIYSRENQFATGSYKGVGLNISPILGLDGMILKGKNSSIAFVSGMGGGIFASLSFIRLTINRK